MLETVFAGLSVVVGCVALVVGVLQLLKCRLRQQSAENLEMHEMGVYLPLVSNKSDGGALRNCLHSRRS